MIHLLQSLPGSSYEAQPNSSTREVTALLSLQQGSARVMELIMYLS